MSFERSNDDDPEEEQDDEDKPGRIQDEFTRLHLGQPSRRVFQGHGFHDHAAATSTSRRTVPIVIDGSALLYRVTRVSVKAGT